MPDPSPTLDDGPRRLQRTLNSADVPVAGVAAGLVGDGAAVGAPDRERHHGGVRQALLAATVRVHQPQGAVGPAVRLPVDDAAAVGRDRGLGVVAGRVRELLEGRSVDVRNEDAYNAAHIRGAKLIPLSDVEKRAGELPKDKLIVTYCT